MLTDLGFSCFLHAAMDDPLPRSLTSRASRRSTPEEESTSVVADLSVSGFHALLFDDDAVASFINSRNALVPWNGDESLVIDRYDVRHLLQDLSTIRKRRAPSSFLDVTDEELNYERYRDLDGLGENDPSSDEVSKAAAGECQLVPFSYSEGVSVNGMNAESRNEGSSFEPPFIVPEFLLSKLPPSQKIHQIMAGTAKFVSEHGGQSEIILRVKQGKNPTFGFLNPDHYLHEYFRFLLDNPELIGGTAKKRPKSAQVSRVSCEGLSLLGSMYGTGDDDDDGDNNDDSIKSQRMNSVESAEFLNNGAVSSQARDQAADCSVREEDSQSLKLPEGAVVSDDGSFGSGLSGVGQSSPVLENEVASASPEKPEVTDQQPRGDNESLQIANTLHTHKNGVVLEPPLPLKRVIEKMVEFILRNGKEFETVVRDRDKTDGRFQFLLPWNEYHSFYLKVLEAAQEETMKKGKKVILNLRSEKISSQEPSRANYSSPLLQDRTKGNSNLNTSQASEAKVLSKNHSHSEKKMKMLIGKKEFIPPNKNNIGQFNNVKMDRSAGLICESAATGMVGVTHKLPVVADTQGIVVSKDQFVQPSEKDENYGMTADDAAAVVMAATRGPREVKQDISSNRTSSSGLGQKMLFTVREVSAGGGSECVNASGGVVGSGMDDVGIAKAVAQAAAFAAAHEADSADAWLTPAEKLKAERLRKAKMFAAMIRTGQNVTEGISVPLGQSIVARTAGSDAVGSGSNIPIDMVNPGTQKVCDSQGYKVSKSSNKTGNRDLESVTEGGSLNALQNGSSDSKHQLNTREHREDGSHEYHLKKRRSHHKDEERHNYSSKRSHHYDSSDVKGQKKNSNHDVGDRSHHKSKRLYAEESIGSENKDSHRRMAHRREASEDMDMPRRKKSRHVCEGDQDGRHRCSKHKQHDYCLSDSTDEKQRARKHQYRSVSPSEVKKFRCAKKSGHKEPQVSLREAIDQLESSECKKTVDKGVDEKEVILRGESNYLTAEEVPDDIRAKVRALLLLNS